MKIVYRAANITEAEIIRGMLAAEGISSHVTGFYLQGGIGELAPTDTARVLVGDEDLDRAIAVIHEYDPEVRPDNRHEPAQGSFLVYWIVVMIVVLVIGGLVLALT